jgi:hypothetical protein
MPTTYTITGRQILTLDRATDRIEPHVGTVTVLGNEIDPAPLTTSDIFDAEGASGLDLYSREGAIVEVTYSDEGENQHPQSGRGSSTSGLTGGLESRTVEELRKEAAAKDISGRSSMDKGELVDALRKAE